ncbi:MAG: RHS repeat-associated core domain-containing protein [Chloroflexi bacterium]|nr:RHS repeat-associated core domain-containing protein [Chloroflexota bacterium]
MKNNIVTKYYFAGATRLAVRTDGTLRFLLGDHLGRRWVELVETSSVTTNASGAKTASALYKAFGETRFTSGTLYTDYKFTGQREESALGGIYFFQSRWFDPSLGRFMSPDTIVPTSTQGTQAWDRYAFVNNNPVRYTDPTGHMGCDPEDETCTEDKARSTTSTTAQTDTPTTAVIIKSSVNGTYYITFYITTAASAANANLSTAAEESYAYGPNAGASLGWLPDALEFGASTYSDFHPDIPYYPITLTASVTSMESGTIINSLGAANGSPTFLGISQVVFNNNYAIKGPSIVAGGSGEINMSLNYRVPSTGAAMKVMMVSHGGFPQIFSVIMGISNVSPACMTTPASTSIGIRR